MGPHKNRNLGQRCAAGTQCRSLEEEMMLKGCTLGSEKVFSIKELMNQQIVMKVALFTLLHHIIL